MEDWINYNFNEHESEEEYWFAQEKMIKIQKEKQVSLEEWNTIWMMFAAKQRRLEELEESEIEIEEIEEENEGRRDQAVPMSPWWPKMELKKLIHYCQ